MPVVTTRPNATVQLGTWTVSGAATAHSALADESDSTYIQHTSVRCRLDPQVCKIALGDVSIPTGAKIHSVRMRVRTERVTGSNTQPQCYVIYYAVVTIPSPRGVQFVTVRKVASFRIPRTSSAGWTTTELTAELQHPDGGEWTQARFNDFEYHLGREDQGGTVRVSAVYADVTYNERPVGTATGPTGTITDTTQPTVTWTYADPESDRQEMFRVKVFSSAQYSAGGFDPETSASWADSGWLPGEDLSWLLNRDVTNGSWRAYVWVQQVWDGLGVHRSVPTFIGWTQNVPGPGTPSLTAAFEDTLNRVRIDLTAGASPATETFNVEYSDDLGLTWAPVRGGTQITAVGGTSATIYDYEARLNRVRRYRVLAFRTLGTVKVGSDYSATVDVQARSLRFWLKDPAAPALNMILPLELDEFSLPRSEGVFVPLVADEAADGDGRVARSIVVSGPLAGRQGEWTLMFTPGQGGQTTWDKFTAIRRAGRVLLWQLPTGEQYYVALVGELPTTWRPKREAAHWRHSTIGYVETDPPPEVTA